MKNLKFEDWWNTQSMSKVPSSLIADSFKGIAFSAWEAAKYYSTGNIWIATMTLSELATHANLNNEYFNHVNVFLVNTKTQVIGYVYNEAKFLLVTESGIPKSVDLLTNMKMEVEILGK